MSELAEEPHAEHGAVKRQRIVRQRRQYNQWAANQTLEDFALRFTAQHARKFSPTQVANTALGSIAFLACEAIGATVAINYGFANAAWALLAVGVIFFATGLPICFYAAKYGVDMDLLTRGAGFGYLGSTITSAIYASFTFILFAFEAAILSAALHLCLGIPLAIGHMISALIVIPFAVYGIKRISWLQNKSQPIWLLLQLVPLVYLATAGSAPLAAALGGDGQLTFNLVKFGGAAAVLLSLLPQIGEQVDYLRFLPAKARIGKRAWWAAVIIPGPGWILIGGVKIMLGAALAFVLLQQGATTTDAAAPTNMYHLAFGSILGNPVAALILTGLFVAICQLKINVTNAYAGSIASSNFFARLTHRHPGRVVWLVFNVIIALMLMEMGILGVVEHVLSLYANLAVAWIGAVTADLMINKPLGLSPKGIEFRRAYLHDVNPVGVGAMGLSVIASSALFFGGLGPSWQALSSLTGLAVAFAAAPAIAWATKGKFYLARPVAGMPQNAQITCIVCENKFEPSDMAACPVYQGSICSLCCSLEARCHDSCKPGGGLLQQSSRLFKRVLPISISEVASVRLVRFSALFLALTALAGVLLMLVYVQQTGGANPALREDVGATLTVVFMGLLIVSAFVSWFFVLAGESRLAAEEETERQTLMLIDEIEAHKRTDAELQRAKEAADAANLAKSRYIVGISHEIRTPLNAISGYAQLLERSPKLDPSDAARVIRRSAAHLGNLVDGLLDISRIENGSLHIDRNKVNLGEFLNQIVDMFRLQASAKGITFRHNWSNLPAYVYVDEKRLRQVLINLLSNAIKYTDHGEASLTVTWRGQVVEFIIADTGRGIAPEDHLRAFAPFERLGASAGVQGVGLGLTISQLLVTVMGGDITLESAIGEGSTFRVKMFMSEAPAAPATPASRTIAGYQGPRRRILVTDDDAFHVDLVREFLEPLGFDLAFARDGRSCIEEAAVRLPDLVMLDIAMPGMNGWEAARALRMAHGDDVSIVMVSANAHDFGVRREDDPHDDFLTKPYEVDALLERIQTQLGLAWKYGVAEEAR
jgi:signal transduction histidine kinase/ActR/RegA family two-component response regulator